MVEQKQKTLNDTVCQEQHRNNQKEQKVEMENIISYFVYNPFLFLSSVLPMEINNFSSAYNNM
jgi:hypothetical protein